MADSVHEDILTLARTRLAALSLPGNAQNRIVERELIAGAWGTGLPVYPFVILSGFGILTDLGTGSSCAFEMAYPLVVCYTDRKIQWDATSRSAQQKAVQKILDAFIHKPLALTYSGASCSDIRFVAGPTSENVDEGWQIIMRQLTFDVHVEQILT